MCLKQVETLIHNCVEMNKKQVIEEQKFLKVSHSKNKDEWEFGKLP